MVKGLFKEYIYFHYKNSSRFFLLSRAAHTMDKATSYSKKYLSGVMFE